MANSLQDFGSDEALDHAVGELVLDRHVRGPNAIGSEEFWRQFQFSQKAAELFLQQQLGLMVG